MRLLRRESSRRWRRVLVAVRDDQREEQAQRPTDKRERRKERKIY